MAPEKARATEGRTWGSRGRQRDQSRWGVWDTRQDVWKLAYKQVMALRVMDMGGVRVKWK
jgi:hypothetical protein